MHTFLPSRAQTHRLILLTVLFLKIFPFTAHQSRNNRTTNSRSSSGSNRIATTSNNNTTM